MPTAWRNTSLPSMRRWPTVLVAMGRHRRTASTYGVRPSADAWRDAALDHARFSRLQHDGAGPVAKQHAGPPVGPVEDAREGFGADDQRAPMRAGGQELVRGGDREHEARTYGLQVEGRAMGDPELRLDLGRGRGEGVIRRRGREHDQVDRRRGSGRHRRAPPWRRPSQACPSSRRRRRCGVRGCRCAARSIRRRCRSSGTIPRSSRCGAATRRRPQRRLI